MNNVNLINLPAKYFRDIDSGTYKVLVDIKTNDNNEIISTTCYLILKHNSKSLAYKLNDNDSCMIFNKLNNLKFKNINYSEHCYRDYHTTLKCNINDKSIKVSIKIKKKQIILYDEENIHDLKPNTKYIISNFTRSSNKNRSTIISKKLKYYIDDNVINILVKYFKCEDNGIYCLYNGKKERVKLTLTTENISCFNKWNCEWDHWDQYSTLRQNLEMKIGNKKFSFYVNNPKFINFDNREEGKYRFLVIYFKDRNIFAYEHKEDKYYCIRDDKYIKKILKDIDQAIAEQYKKGCNLNVYTYLLLNNEKRGLTIKDKSKFSERYRLSKLSRVFQTKLDITLVQRG